MCCLDSTYAVTCTADQVSTRGSYCCTCGASYLYILHEMSQRKIELLHKFNLFSDKSVSFPELRIGEIQLASTISGSRKWAWRFLRVSLRIRSHWALVMALALAGITKNGHSLAKSLEKICHFPPLFCIANAKAIAKSSVWMGPKGSFSNHSLRW